MPHYSVFVTLFLTEEVDAPTSEAARKQVEEKYAASGADYSVDEVVQEPEDANE